MPRTLEDIENSGAPIYYLKKGEIHVRVGPCSASFLSGDIIPLDGRHYVCSGTIILKNGIKLRANFEINTHTFDFLDLDTVEVYIEEQRAWYRFKEAELYDVLGISEEEALPYTWEPDRPLDYHKKGPYPMHFWTPNSTTVPTSTEAASSERGARRRATAWMEIKKIVSKSAIIFLLGALLGAYVTFRMQFQQSK